MLMPEICEYVSHDKKGSEYPVSSHLLKHLIDISEHRSVKVAILVAREAVCEATFGHLSHGLCHSFVLVLHKVVVFW